MIYLVYDGDYGVVAIFSTQEKADDWKTKNNVNSRYGLRIESFPVDVDISYRYGSALTRKQYTCDKCHQVSEDKLCLECYCAVCGDELEAGWCVECSASDEEIDNE